MSSHEFSGFSADEGLSPSIYLYNIQEFSDLLLIGAVALHKGHA